MNERIILDEPIPEQEPDRWGKIREFLSDPSAQVASSLVLEGSVLSWVGNFAVARAIEGEYDQTPAIYFALAAAARAIAMAMKCCSLANSNVNYSKYVEDYRAATE